MINVGYGNFVQSKKVLAVLNPASSPVKRLIQEMKKNRSLLDATYGRKIRSVLVLESGHLLISSHSSEVVAQKLTALEEGK